MEMEDGSRGSEGVAQGLRVLLVEDDVTVAEALEALLQSLGHQVIGVARHGGEAVESASSLLPDLVVMDIKLPVRDGIEATRTILAERAVPVILLTGYANEELVQRARSAGVMAYLLKPVDQRQLHSTIEVALARFAELDTLKREVSSLREELETRKLVEQAKGILMRRLRLSEPEAFRRMQRQSRTTRTTLRETASKILSAEQLLAPFDQHP
jgi:response regulator NasT